MVVAPETTYEGAVVLGERIRSSVERHPFAYNDEAIRVTVSAGFAVVEAGTPVEFGQIKHLSAMALGEAKAGGRNRSVILRALSSVWRETRLSIVPRPVIHATITYIAVIR